MGTEVIYAAQSPSLAALEVLVHFSVLPKDFVMTEVEIPDSATILRLEEADLTLGWDREEPIRATQAIGDEWVREASHAIFSVPSSIVAPERNFILNPAHAAFRSLRFLPSAPFRFDSRLK